MPSSGQPKPIKRVLIYRLGSLGDTVVALPSLHLIERAFPQAERRMLTNFPISSKAAAAAALLGDNGLVHGYFRYTIGTRSKRALLQLWWSIFRWRPQVLVYIAAGRGLEAARRDARFFRFCGVSHQIGVPLTEEMQSYKPQPPDNTLEYECEHLARNIASLGDAHVDTPAAWDLRLTDAERARAAAVCAPAGDRPILAISIGTKVQCNEWGNENWRGLLSVLGKAHPHLVLALIGTREEIESSEYVADGWREGAGAGALVLNLCGQLTPRESAACLASARLFIGHDSGPMHLAATVGTQCVAIFAARIFPHVWFPYGKHHRVLYHPVDCMGCNLETCIVQQKKCILSITIEEVAAEVRAALTPEEFPILAQTATA